MKNYNDPNAKLRADANEAYLCGKTYGYYMADIENGVIPRRKEKVPKKHGKAAITVKEPKITRGEEV